MVSRRFPQYFKYSRRWMYGRPRSHANRNRHLGGYFFKAGPIPPWLYSGRTLGTYGQPVGPKVRSRQYQLARRMMRRGYRGPRRIH